MNFKDVEIQSEYDSINDDIYDGFFNNVLKHSIKYSRIGGKFTSRHFAACAEGLQEFIQNDGIMKLVLLPEFSKDDFDAINNGTKDVSDVLSEGWIKDLSQVKDKFVADHTKALAWMLANGYLEIKIIIPVNENGSVVSQNVMHESQIFKHKAGVFWDTDNNAISFSGNIEFDDQMFGEYYRFRVYRGWDEGEKKYVDMDFDEFNKYWEGAKFNDNIRLKSMPLPDAICDNLISIAPKSKSEIRLENIPKLRPYQKDAIHKWLDNKGRGVFEMATGTGKTFTAIGCIDEMQKDDLLVVIVCPYDNLERQWKKELAKWGFDSMITSGTKEWGRMIKDKIASLRLRKTNLLIVITTYKTFSSDKFVDIIENYGGPSMIIADEVHNGGSPTYASGLTNAYHYRLGLSATIERYFDPEGTLELQNFFGDTVFTFDLEHAIKKGFLVGYYYYPIFADLNEEEYEKYRKLTRKIAQLWSTEPIDRKMLEFTLIKRSEIIRDAKSKIGKFQEWLKTHSNDAKYALVYCSGNQMTRVKNLLTESGLANREITAKNPSNPHERSEILKKLSNGGYDTIVANRVLDEGADIPAAKNCIMLASDGNPKQFVQRRGRVLRKFSGTYQDGSTKEYAKIYDVLIVPELSNDYSKDEIKTETQIVASQIRRQMDLARIAINHESCMDAIKELKRKFQIE